MLGIFFKIIYHRNILLIVSAILSKLWFSGFCEVGLYKDQLRDESLYSINIKISHILLFLKSLSLKDHIPIDIFLNEIAFYRPNAEAIRDFLSAEVFQILSKSQIISYFIYLIDDRKKKKWPSILRVFYFKMILTMTKNVFEHEFGTFLNTLKALDLLRYITIVCYHVENWIIQKIRFWLSWIFVFFRSFLRFQS